MRRIASAVLSLLLLGGLAVVGLDQPAQAGAPCPVDGVHVRGRVTDVTTGRPLSEVTSVGVTPEGSDVGEGYATNANSRYDVCLSPGTYNFVFRADNYRVNAAARKVVEVTSPGPIILNVALQPRGLVLAGRITNANGRPRFASIGILRQRPNGRWVSIDGEGNDPRTGVWSYRVPGPGRYRVNASVDHHWSRWHRDAVRLSHARVLRLNARTPYIRNVNIAVPYCNFGGGAFCVPWGFLT